MVAWYVDSRASASGKYMRLKEILRRMSRGEDVRIPPELADVRDYLLKLKPRAGEDTTILIQDLNRVLQGDLSAPVPSTSALSDV